VIAACNRNQDSWENPPPGVTPLSPNGRYSSANAIAKTQLFATDYKDIKQSFILIMINFCPFITRKPWSKIKNPAGQQALLSAYNMGQYIGDLFKAIGADVDLWIGHSAIYGTVWVWPSFLGCMASNPIKNWLLTPNLNPQALLNTGNTFRKTSHPLHPLFR
jgi:hypothetical protein